jgi:5-methyltetrahydrofolate--homocysteine methyltransferase
MNSSDPAAWLAAQPNAGVPSVTDGKTVYDVGAEEMASWTRRFLESGVRIIGSCCGSSPDHTRAIVRQIGVS